MMRFNSYITQATLQLLNDEKFIKRPRNERKKILDLGENIQPLKKKSVIKVAPKTSKRAPIVNLKSKKQKKTKNFATSNCDWKTNAEKLVQEILPQQPDDEKSDLPDFETPLIAPVMGNIKTFGEKRRRYLSIQGVEISASRHACPGNSHWKLYFLIG